MDDSPIIIGLDFGGVLSILNGLSHAEHVSTSINMPDAIEKLTELLNPSVTARRYKFVVISFCGYSRAVQTLDALKEYPHLFKEMYFVKKRKYKAELCKYLGCHIMVDDNSYILNCVKMMNPKITTVCFGGKCENADKCVDGWNKLFELIENYEPVSTLPDLAVDISNLLHDVR